MIPALMFLQRPRTSRLFLQRKKRQRLMSSSGGSLRPWPMNVVESNGDYKEDSWLEEHIGGPLYEHQRSLPRLPVPTLEDTLRRFLPTVLPLVASRKQAETLQLACLKFEEQAANLQTKLLERAKQQDQSSWLQYWWNSQGYLAVRDPVCVNVSYILQLNNDPSIELGSEQAMIQRAASVLKSAFEYRGRICSGKLPQERIGKEQTLLCSTQFKYFFHACRVPQLAEDTYRMYDPSAFQHAIVACRNQFYRIEMQDEEGRPFGLKALEDQLHQIRQDAPRETTATAELGWLTSQNRDEWARCRKKLVELGASDMLEELESGMLLLCLDEGTSAEFSSLREDALTYLHGNLHSTANRWFDKSIQLSVTRAGRVGLIGEHSMMDGLPVVGFCRYLEQQTYAKQQWEEESCENATTTQSPSPRNLFAGLNNSQAVATLQPLIETAKETMTQLVNRTELQILAYETYGSEWIKQAGFSPDAFVQIAIQLATSRLMRGPQATYESTQVRPFLHGRTETTRSLSPNSVAFCEAMDKGEKTSSAALQTLLEACESHVKYMRLAAEGQGVDRHFLGLSMVAEPQETLPDLLTHPLFLRSKRWRVSTSALSVFAGFGPVVEDGVGIAYTVRSDKCLFTLTSRTKSAYSKPLHDMLSQALDEMKSLVESSKDAPKSKL